ncbi:MAG: co-chaperone GroES [bacterium]
MAAKIRPLADKIVVKLTEEAKQTTGGIFIPDSSQESFIKAEVIAIGPGKLLDSGSRQEMEVKVGDVVLFEKYGKNSIKINNTEYILSVADLLGIIE